MTIEEALKILSGPYKIRGGSDEPTTTLYFDIRIVELFDALNMALDALRAKQEPKSPCWVCGYGGRYLDVPPCAPNGIGDSGCPAHPKLPAKGAADRE